MRILVTGASGLLGLNFGLHLASAYAGQHTVIGVANQHALRDVPFQLITCDLAEAGAGERLLAQTRPDLVLHCAAIANLETCETQPELARRINAELPGELAAVCLRQEKPVRMLHISTDAVFDGVSGNYSEEDTPNPLSVYARTKLEGEQAVLSANPHAFVARVNFYGWSLSGTRSLSEAFYNNLSVGKGMLGFTDVFFCPLEVTTLCTLLLRAGEAGLGGLYHVFSSETLSKYDFGCRLARRFGFDERLIRPVSWKEGGLKAARSPNLIMRTEKLARALGEPMPGQAAGLERFFSLYEQGFPARLRSLAGG